MQINDIITEEIRLDELFGKVTFAPNGDATTGGKKYVWDKNYQNWYLAGTKELIAKNSATYSRLAKAYTKQLKKVAKQAGKNPGRGRLAPDTYGDKPTIGKGIQKGAAAAGRYLIDVPSDAFAGVLKKGYNAVSKALGGTLGPSQPGQQNQGFQKGDRVSFISNHATSKGKQVNATVRGQSANNPDHYQVKSDTNPNPFLIPANRLTKIQA